MKNDVLGKLVGRTFYYGTDKVKVLYYEQTELKIRIVTDLKVIETSVDKLKGFLNEFTPAAEVDVVEDQAARTATLAGVSILPAKSFDNTMSKLDDMIARVEAEKDYIPQAMAINKLIGSKISLARTMIEGVNAMKEK